MLGNTFEPVGNIWKWLPFGVYTSINPTNAPTSANIYLASIDRDLVLLQWFQMAFINGGLNNGLNFWSISLIGFSSPSVSIATLSTNPGPVSTWLTLNTVTFAPPSISYPGTPGLLIQVVPTGNPGPLYIGGPALRVLTG